MRLKPHIATPEVENIIFDFGNVLLDIDIDLTIRAFRHLGLSGLNATEIHPHNAGVFLALELGEISGDEFAATLRSYVPAGNPVPTDQQILDAWNALLLGYEWRRFEMLDRLRESGYKVFLLSNTNLPHRLFFIDKFNRENTDSRTFESYFDGCFYSDAMGLRKPDPTIYLETLRGAGITSPERTLFIDDNKHNTEAAKKLGIQTHHLKIGNRVIDLFDWEA